MSSNPQLNASNYVLNIVELQNTITVASGLSPIVILSNQVQGIASMVDTTRKQININFISNYNLTPIEVLAPINLSNVTLSYNNNVVTGGGFGSGNYYPSKLVNGSTIFSLFSTSVNGGPLASLTTNSSNVFNVNSNGAIVFNSPVSFSSNVQFSSNYVQANPIISTGAGLGKVLVCEDLRGTSSWGYASTLATADSIVFNGAIAGEMARFTDPDGFLGLGNTNPQYKLDVTGNANFTGRISAFDFLSLSDRRFKTDITGITANEATGILRKVQGVRFMWRDLSSNDIGVIAQELQKVLPEAVLGDEETHPKLSVAYHKLIPVMVEVIKSLDARVTYLEGLLTR
jgi:Chaperone of endosialidase